MIPYLFNRPLYIFDLDGTLALTDHRQHILDNKDDAHRWDKFFAACVDDPPNEPVIRTLKALRKAGAEVWVWSGRSEDVRPQTEEWLYKHGVFRSVPFLNWEPFTCPWMLLMRKSGDFTPDEVLKFGWLADLEPPERSRLIAIFDDRRKVVEMWRKLGVPCFQVAEGAF